MYGAVSYVELENWKTQKARAGYVQALTIKSGVLWQLQKILRSNL